MTPQAVVEALYFSLLGRHPASGEESTKVLHLEQGGSVADVVSWILASPECQLWFYRTPAFADITFPEPLPLEVPRLYLWHVPKTGGTSLREMLRPHFHEMEFCGDLTLSELFQMSAYRLRSFRVIAGHFGPTLPALLPEVPLVSATLIRDPVDQVVSHYLHWRHKGHPSDPLAVLARSMTLDQWCRADATRSVWFNPQATALCSFRVPPTREEATVGSEGRTVVVPEVDLHERALHILSDIDVAGTTDALVPVYRACLRELGLEPLLNEPLRENVGQGTAPPVSPETRQWILEHNTIDSALLELANARCAESSRPATKARSLTVLTSYGTDGVTAGSKTTPWPAKRDSLVPQLSVRRLSTLAVAVSALVALIDSLLAGVVLIGLLVVGPCCAVLTGRWSATVIAGAWALLLGTLVAIPDGIWGTSAQAAYLASLAVVSFAAACLTLAIGRQSGTYSSRAVSGR